MMDFNFDFDKFKYVFDISGFASIGKIRLFPVKVLVLTTSTRGESGDYCAPYCDFKVYFSSQHDILRKFQQVEMQRRAIRVKIYEIPRLEDKSEEVKFKMRGSKIRYMSALAYVDDTYYDIEFEKRIKIAYALLNISLSSFVQGLMPIKGMNHVDQYAQ